MIPSLRRFPKMSLAWTALCFGISLGALADESPPPTGGPTSTVVVNVGTFRNRQGTLGCRLFRTPAGFPETSAGTVEKRVPITADVTPCSFENVAAGTYAISVMHDENGNQKLDKNLFGVPTEGYGVSNNHTHAMTSPDGTHAPIFIVRARSTAPRSNAPLILYAYGAFGYSLEPSYHRDLPVWLDRGGVYAEAVIRGGGEYGGDWHRAGMGKNRKNVYDDFFAASETLVKEGWTSPDRLLIRGVSAGGLLVAVAETEKPSLFRGVIAEVPMSDMIRYPLGHDSGTLWLDEYGSPSKPDEFETLYRYSPYHRIHRGTHYPATLILASEHDQRLDPMHGRKLAAALEDADPCNTVLLRVERDGGHSGATHASAWLEETADLYTFAAGLVGMTR